MTCLRCGAEGYGIAPLGRPRKDGTRHPFRYCRVCLQVTKGHPSVEPPGEAHRRVNREHMRRVREALWITSLDGGDMVTPIQTETPPVKGAFPQVFPDLRNTIPARYDILSSTKAPAPGKASSGITPERRSTASPRPRETRPVDASQGAEDYGVTADLGPSSERAKRTPRRTADASGAPPPGNGGRVPRYRSASGSAS